MEVDDLINSIQHNENEIVDISDKALTLALHEAIIESVFKKIKNIIKHRPQLILARAQNNNLLFFEVMSRNRIRQIEWLIRHISLDLKPSSSLKVLMKRKQADIFDHLAYAIMSYSGPLNQDSLEAKIIEKVLLFIPNYFSLIEKFIRSIPDSDLALNLLIKARCLKLIEDSTHNTFELPNEIKTQIINAKALSIKQINKLFEYINTHQFNDRPEHYLAFIGIDIFNQIELYEAFQTIKYLLVKYLLKNSYYCHGLIIDAFASCVNHNLDELLFKVIKNEEIHICSSNVAIRYNNQGWKKYRDNNKILPPIVRYFIYALVLDEKNFGYLYYKLAQFKKKHPLLAINNQQINVEVYYTKAYELCNNYINGRLRNAVETQYYYYLARMYEKGCGTKVNLQEAIKFYNLTVHAKSSDILYYNKAKQCLSVTYLSFLNSLTDSHYKKRGDTQEIILAFKQALLTYNVNELERLLKIPLYTQTGSDTLRFYFGNAYQECLLNAYEIGLEWHYKQNTFRLAISLYSFILWLESSHYMARFHRASAFRFREEFAFALADIDYLKKNFPENKAAFYLEVITYFEKGEQEFAKKLFENLEKHHTEDCYTIFLRAKVLRFFERYIEALAEIDKVIQASLNSVTISNYLITKARLLSYIGENESALEIINHAMSNSKYFIEPYDYLLKAEIYEALDSKILAQFNYQQAWEKYLVLMQNNYFGNYTHCRFLLDRLNIFHPEYNTFQTMLDKLNAIYSSKDFSQALPLLKQLEQYDKNEKIYCMLASCYRYTRQLSECLEAIIDAFIVAPEKFLSLQNEAEKINDWLLDLFFELPQQAIEQKLNKLLPYEYKLFILVLSQIIMNKYSENNVNARSTTTVSAETKSYNSASTKSSAQLISLYSTLFGPASQSFLLTKNTEIKSTVDVNNIAEANLKKQLLCFKPY